MRQVMNTITIDFSYNLGELKPSETMSVGVAFSDTKGKEIEHRRYQSCTGVGEYSTLPRTKAELINETLEEIRKFMEEALRGEHEGADTQDEFEW